MFVKEGEEYNISFIDFPALSDIHSVSIESGFDMADGVLSEYLYNLENIRGSFPKSTNPSAKYLPKGSFVTMMCVDTDKYRKYHDTKVVKKTLTIPSWLNELALKNNVNFSQVLKEALIKELNLGE